jgi:hypothetical protein
MKLESIINSVLYSYSPLVKNYIISDRKEIAHQLVQQLITEQVLVTQNRSTNPRFRLGTDPSDAY